MTLSVLFAKKNFNWNQDNRIKISHVVVENVVELKVIGNNRQVIGSIPITPTKTTSNRNYKMTPAKLQYYQDRFQHELNRNSFLKALCPNHLTETQQTIIQSFVKERIQNETSLRA